MKAHIIENGTITNTIAVDSLDFLPNIIDASIGGGIGWGYVDGVLMPPAPAPKPVPTSVTMRQARLQLLALGVLSAIKAAMATMSEAAQIEFEYASSVGRDNPLTAGIATLLDWDDAELDTYFIEANKL